MKKPIYTIREKYTERIRPYINTQIIKVIVGQRRVGKSYLLFQLMDEVRKQFPKADILYINKELFEFDNIRTYVDLVQYVHANKQNNTEKCFLFLDERRYEMSKDRYLGGKIGFLDYSVAQNERDLSQIGYIQTLKKIWTKYYEIRKLTLFDFIENKQIEVEHNFKL